MLRLFPRGKGLSCLGLRYPRRFTFAGTRSKDRFIDFVYLGSFWHCVIPCLVVTVRAGDRHHLPEFVYPPPPAEQFQLIAFRHHHRGAV